VKKGLMILVGVAICLVGVWFGAWLCEMNPQGESLYAFASFATGFFVFVVGCVVVVFSAESD